MLVLVAGALAFGLLLAAQTAVMFQVRGVTINLATAVANVLYGLAWAALVPLVVRLARLWPVVGPRWRRGLLVHVGAASLANGVVGVIMVIVTRPIDVPEAPPAWVLLVSNYFATHALYLVLWLVIAALTHAYDAAAEARERERRAAELEAQLAHAQLDALRAQLDPHFLFNTLNAVSTLMARDVAAARTVLGDLSALLRLALDRMGDSEVALADEIDFLQHYLDIERTRFGDRLVVSLDVGAELDDALVPPLVLQPLVENALKHAVAPRPEGGTVEVRAMVDDLGDLVLSVRDDGPGLPREGAVRVGGLGLVTTRGRLTTLYGDGATLDVVSARGFGTVATVRLPFHTDPVL